METIVKNYLVKTIGNINVNVDKFIDVISRISDHTDDILRIIGYVTDNIKEPVVDDVYLVNGSSLSKIKYDIITNRVQYKGIKLVKRYFADNDDIPLADTVFENSYDIPGKSHPDDTHTNAVNLYYRVFGNMSYDEWQSNK